MMILGSALTPTHGALTPKIANLGENHKMGPKSTFPDLYHTLEPQAPLLGSKMAFWWPQNTDFRSH